MLGLENWDGGLKSPQVQYEDNNIIHVTCTSITVGSGTSLSTISKQVLYVCLVIFRGTSVLCTKREAGSIVMYTYSIVTYYHSKCSQGVCG